MKNDVATLNEIRERGLEALAKALGPEGLVLFLRQFNQGHGDYTVQRRAWLKKAGMKDLGERLLSMQKTPQRTSKSAAAVKRGKMRK